MRKEVIIIIIIKHNNNYRIPNMFSLLPCRATDFYKKWGGVWVDDAQASQ